MADIVDTVVTALKGARKAWGANVHYRFPTTFSLLPCLGVYEMTSTDLQAGDNKGCSCFDHHITVDLWDKKQTGRAKLSQYKTDIKTTLYALDMGVTCEGIQELDDGDNVHLVFEFYMIGGKYGVI